MTLNTAYKLTMVWIIIVIFIGVFTGITLMLAPTPTKPEIQLEQIANNFGRIHYGNDNFICLEKQANLVRCRARQNGQLIYFVCLNDGCYVRNR